MRKILSKIIHFFWCLSHNRTRWGAGALQLAAYPSGPIPQCIDLLTSALAPPRLGFRPEPKTPSYVARQDRLHSTNGRHERQSEGKCMESASSTSRKRVVRLATLVEDERMQLDPK